VVLRKDGGSQCFCCRPVVSGFHGWLRCCCCCCRMMTKRVQVREYARRWKMVVVRCSEDGWRREEDDGECVKCGGRRNSRWRQPRLPW